MVLTVFGLRAPDVLTPEFTTALARAAGEGREGTVLIGRDTRRSGDVLVAALTTGFTAAGLDVQDAGIIPTAAVAYLSGETRATFGVVVSASHNPAEDNGIKFFGGNGAKLSDDLEDAIEARLRQGAPWVKPPAGLGIRMVDADARARYVNWLAAEARFTHRGLEIAIDCANGAAFQAAPELFNRLGADVMVTADAPDGTNINENCGATNPGTLAAIAEGRLGFCFDGDSDRLICVDETGQVANGDVIMAVIASHMQKEGQLKGDRVVGTVMANLGFMRAMEREGIEVVATPVGDRYVAEAMKETGAVLGGEQSGHVIFSDVSKTGDGLLTAIRAARCDCGYRASPFGLAQCHDRVSPSVEKRTGGQQGFTRHGRGSLGGRGGCRSRAWDIGTNPGEAIRNRTAGACDG